MRHEQPARSAARLRRTPRRKRWGRASTVGQAVEGGCSWSGPDRLRTGQQEHARRHDHQRDHLGRTSPGPAAMLSPKATAPMTMLTIGIDDAHGRQRRVEGTGLERALGEDHAPDTDDEQSVGLPVGQKEDGAPVEQVRAGLGQRRGDAVDDPGRSRQQHRPLPGWPPATQGDQAQDGAPPALPRSMTHTTGRTLSCPGLRAGDGEEHGQPGAHQHGGHPVPGPRASGPPTPPPEAGRTADRISEGAARRPECRGRGRRTEGRSRSHRSPVRAPSPDCAAGEPGDSAGGLDPAAERPRHAAGAPRPGRTSGRCREHSVSPTLLRG